MTHRDEPSQRDHLAAIRIVLEDDRFGLVQTKFGYKHADAVIAYYKANPDALLNLISECGGPVNVIAMRGAYMLIKAADNNPGVPLYNDTAAALARRWVEGT
jgi:hypothetical protein